VRATAILSARLPRFDLAYAIEYARASLRVRREAVLLLAVALIIDLGFVALHIAQSATGFASEDAYVYQDGGYAEWFDYLKYAALLVMTLALLKRSGNLAYLTLATLSAFLLLDDSLMIHEHVGDWVAPHLPFETLAGLQAKDFGELGTYAVAGSVFLFAAVAGQRNQDIESRKFLHGVYAIILGLAFFAAGLDMLHSIAEGIIGQGVIPGLGLIEDSGEMFVTSVMVAFVLDRLLSVAGHSESERSTPD
jgi:hypothetical protein